MPEFINYRNNPPVEEGTKTCFKCHLEQSVHEFYPHRSQRDGRLNKCRTCTIAESKAWRDANPEKHTMIRRRRELWNKYGISTDEYDRLYEKQGGKCAGCGSDSPGRSVHFPVDHDHATEEVRGLLCSPCNVALGWAKEDPARLRGLAAYIEKWRPTA